MKQMDSYYRYMRFFLCILAFQSEPHKIPETFLLSLDLPNRMDADGFLTVPIQKVVDILLLERIDIMCS